jgi:hypothetical protein
MLGRRLTVIFDHHIGLREKTAILGVGRDLWMLAVGTVVFLSNYLMQVNIESIICHPSSFSFANSVSLR